MRLYTGKSKGKQYRLLGYLFRFFRHRSMYLFSQELYMFGQLIDDLNQTYSKLKSIYFFKTCFAFYTPYKTP